MKVGLFCKTFRRDLGRFERLYASVQAYDRDGLPFLVSVPECDRSLFVRRFGAGTVDWTTDEVLVGGPIAQSWRMQQVVKLNAWKAGFAEAFLMLDSDFYFIRDFHARDFLGPDGSARFVVSREWHKYDPANERLISVLRGEAELVPVSREECRNLVAPRLEPRGIPRWRLWLDRLTKPPVDDRMRRIRPLFGRAGPEYHVMPGPVWTRDAHRRFLDEFVREKRLSYFDLIRFSPWEYVWIAEWLLAQGLPNLTPSEPMFLHFDSDASIQHARALGFRVEDFAKRYLGLALAENHHAQKLGEY